MNLSFQADLEITGASNSVKVGDDGAGALVITTPELRPLLEALRSDGLLPAGSLRAVSDRLAETGGTVHLRTPSTELLTLGSEAVPTAVTRVVGLHHVRIQSLRGLLVALRPPLRSALPAVAAGGLIVVLTTRRLRRWGRRASPSV